MVELEPLAARVSVSHSDVLLEAMLLELFPEHMSGMVVVRVVQNV